MQNKINGNSVTIFFCLELCREYQVESNVTKHNKVRDNTLEHKDGQHLFAKWRILKVVLSDS